MSYKKIVSVLASFEEEEELFKTLKKFSQYADNQFAYWDEIAFTINYQEETDGCLVFNAPTKKTNIKCYPELVIAFMMEPGVKALTPWMYKNLEQYSKVYSPVLTSANTIASHGFLGWEFKHSYQYLSQLTDTNKNFNTSCIASGINVLPGHRLRNEFVRTLQQEMPDIHYYGRGIKPLADKLDGLLPYRFSIAIENSSIEDYFTEKISDCFLSYTVPFYYGCKNISKYFPENSYIWIDITNPHKAIKTIKEAANESNWLSRLEAVKEARELVLNKYQPLAGAAAIFKNIPITNSKQLITLKPTRNELNRMAFSLLSKLKLN